MRTITTYPKVGAFLYCAQRRCFNCESSGFGLWLLAITAHQDVTPVTDGRADSCDVDLSRPPKSRSHRAVCTPP